MLSIGESMHAIGTVDEKVDTCLKFRKTITMRLSSKSYNLI